MFFDFNSFFVIISYHICVFASTNSRVGIFVSVHMTCSESIESGLLFSVSVFPEDIIDIKQRIT